MGANKIDLTKDTVYTHPQEKQCSWNGEISFTQFHQTTVSMQPAYNTNTVNVPMDPAFPIEKILSYDMVVIVPSGTITTYMNGASDYSGLTIDVLWGPDSPGIILGGAPIRCDSTSDYTGQVSGRSGIIFKSSYIPDNTQDMTYGRFMLSDGIHSASSYTSPSSTGLVSMSTACIYSSYTKTRISSVNVTLTFYGAKLASGL